MLTLLFMTVLILTLFCMTAPMLALFYMTVPDADNVQHDSFDDDAVLNDSSDTYSVQHYSSDDDSVLNDSSNANMFCMTALILTLFIMTGLKV